MDAARFDPQDPAFAERVRASFARQGAMHTIGASLGEVAPGRVVIELDWQQGLTQQHGFLHAGIVATALDSACGYAASSLMPAEGWALLEVSSREELVEVTKAFMSVAGDGRSELIQVMDGPPPSA